MDDAHNVCTDVRETTEEKPDDVTWPQRCNYCVDEPSDAVLKATCTSPIHRLEVTMHACSKFSHQEWARLDAREKLIEHIGALESAEEKEHKRGGL